MRAAMVIDSETGRPKVEAIREANGTLRFGYYTVRPGGMVVLASVPPEALSGRRIEDTDDARLANALGEEIEALTHVVAASAARGEGAEIPQPGIGSTPRNLDREKEEAELAEAKRVADAAATRVDEVEETLAAKDVDLAAKDAEAEALRARIAELEAGGDPAGPDGEPDPGEAKEAPKSKSAPRKSRAKAAA